MASHRFLILAPGFPPQRGGIERYLGGLANALGPDRVVVLAPEVPGAEAWDRDSNLTVCRLPQGRLWPVSWLLGIRRVLAQYPCQALVVGHIRLGPIGYLAGLWSRLPVLHFAYGMEITAGRFAGLKRFLWQRSERVITISHFSAECVIQAGARRDRVVLLPPGLDEVDVFAGGDAEAFRARYELGQGPILLTVARLDARERYKGHDEVLTVMPELIKRFAGLVYVVVGDGDDRSRLEGRARELGIESNVRFLGAVSDSELVDVYALADVFVMPGREAHDKQGLKFEGFGIVFLEAAAAGLPVVAGRAGGAPDAVVDGETGFLVEPQSTEELIRALSRLLAEPELARKMGERGTEWVNHHFRWQCLPVAERLTLGVGGQP